MKKYVVFTLLAMAGLKTVAQERAITTAVPFLSIAADPRSAAMGDMGVVTSSDAYAQQWNPAKLAFSESKQGIGVTYTPYLSKLVNDIFLGNISYYNRLNERSALGASLRYFSNGEIELRESFDSSPFIAKPNELAVDLSYSLRLSEEFAMAIAGRYIHSDLKLQTGFDDASAANSIAVDIAGFYQSPIAVHEKFDGRWRAGFNVSNLGPKMKYDNRTDGAFLPTNLALGVGYDFILDAHNKVAVSAEFNKLLVPTPPELLNADSDVESGQDYREINRQRIDDYNNIGWFSGAFKSFGDAPDGFSEELKEFTWALGAEYWYDNAFALRAGYFHESEDKGAREFFSLGAGFKYTTINLDISYLFSTSKTNNPLEGTLRFGLTFNFGDGAYNEDY